MNKEQLQTVLEQHKLWLQDRSTGERANFRNADLRFTNLRGADLYDANLYGADLRGANLGDADLRYANLFDANLFDANLRYADLRGADLRYANLSGANLHGANVLRFQYQQHEAIYTGCEMLSIGCEKHTLEHWLEHYEAIGEKHNYSTDEINEYYEFIQKCYKRYKK